MLNISFLLCYILVIQHWYLSFLNLLPPLVVNTQWLLHHLPLGKIVLHFHSSTSCYIRVCLNLPLSIPIPTLQSKLPSYLALTSTITSKKSLISSCPLRLFLLTVAGDFAKSHFSSYISSLQSHCSSDKKHKILI